MSEVKMKLWAVGISCGAVLVLDAEPSVLTVTIKWETKDITHLQLTGELNMLIFLRKVF